MVEASAADLPLQLGAGGAVAYDQEVHLGASSPGPAGGLEHGAEIAAGGQLAAEHHGEAFTLRDGHALVPGGRPRREDERVGLDSRSRSA